MNSACAVWRVSYLPTLAPFASLRPTSACFENSLSFFHLAPRVAEQQSSDFRCASSVLSHLACEIAEFVATHLTKQCSQPAIKYFCAPVLHIWSFEPDPARLLRCRPCALARKLPPTHPTSRAMTRMYCSPLLLHLPTQWTPSAIPVRLLRAHLLPEYRGLDKLPPPLLHPPMRHDPTPPPGTHPAYLQTPGPSWTPMLPPG